MDTDTYCFSNFAEHDDLSKLAVKAKEIMQQNDNIIQIFGINNDILYGNSPKQVLFLMKLNKQSLFSPPSSNENSPSRAKSNERKSTPTNRNPDTSNMPRKYLPFDDAEEKEQHPATLEFSTPTGRRKPILQPAVEATPNPNVEKTGTRDEQCSSQVGSAGNLKSLPTTEIARMTTNLTMAEKDIASPIKVHGSIDASSQESSPTTEITMMTTDLTMDEKEFGSPLIVHDGIDASCQESPASDSFEVSIMNASLSMAGKKSRSPTKEIGKIKLEDQESPRSAELTKMASSLTVDDKDSRNIIRDDQQAGNCTRNKDSPNPEEIAGKSESTDSSNKYFISHAKGMKTSEPAPSLLRNLLLGICETTSPVKRAKTGSIPTFDIQEPSSPKKDAMAENSPEDTKRTVSRTPGAKLNISPIETIKGMARDDRKRKSLSPTRRSTAPFKTVPKVVKLECEEEIGVEVVDLEYGASPTTSRSKSADYRRDSTKDSTIKSLLVGESKTDTSPKTPERYLHPSERAITSCFFRILSGTNRPGCSADIDSSSTDIESNPTLLKFTIQKFNMLLDLRDRSMKNSFLSFQCFQTGISYTNNYVLSAFHIILMIDVSGKCSTKEFKKIVRDANAIAEKLLNKLRSWEKDIDLNLYAWHKCFQQIKQLKAKYEPLFTNEGEPAVTFEAMQVYESEMRALWKEMDGMVMLGDSRRALFAHISHDVERLIKMLVKCLILVGILQPY